MKVKYIVLFDDSVESYCSTIREVCETVNDAVKMYSCDLLPEKTIRRGIEVYEVKRVKVKV